MKIEKLNWDSEFFGYQIGKLHLKEANYLNEGSFLEKSKPYKLVYVYSENPVTSDNITLKHVDSKVTFHKNLQNVNITHKQSSCTPYKGNDNDFETLLKLAYESGKYSRFRRDTNFVNNEFEKLYKRWVIDSIKKIIAMEVLVYRDNSNIAGMITVADKRNGLAAIGLLAVSPEHQGKGIGGKLIGDAEYFVKMRNYSFMQVVTQEINKDAMKVYFKNEYVISDIIHIYHYWNV